MFYYKQDNNYICSSRTLNEHTFEVITKDEYEQAIAEIQVREEEYLAAMAALKEEELTDGNSENSF